MRSLNGNCQNCSNGNELIILENKYNSSFLRSEDLRWNRPGPELEKQYYCWTSKVWYPCSCQTCVRRQETGAISRFIFTPSPTTLLICCHVARGRGERGWRGYMASTESTDVQQTNYFSKQFNVLIFGQSFASPPSVLWQ